MRKICIAVADTCQQIEAIMTSCGDAFFDQRLNNKDDINRLSQKFAKFGRVLAAFDGDVPAGFVAYYVNSETKTAYISMIILQKAYQGQGVGSMLLTEMLADCRNMDQQKVRLEVAKRNENAIAFYEKRGFVREGQASEDSDYYSLTL